MELKILVEEKDIFIIKTYIYIMIDTARISTTSKGIGQSQILIQDHI